MKDGPSPLRNRLLNAMPVGAVAALRPHMGFVDLPRGTTVDMSTQRMASVYFLEAGAVSIMIGVGEERFELALVGREGMLGTPSLLANLGAGCDAVVVLAAVAVAIPMTVFHRVLHEQPAARAIVLRFAQVQVTQLAHNSFANGQLTTLRRVARWLLMAHDRCEGDTLMISQSTLSLVLGLHRPRVTEALHRLEEIQAIRSERAQVRIADRDKLTAMVGPCYGPAERAYDSLIGPAPADRTVPQADRGEAGGPSSRADPVCPKHEHRSAAHMESR